MRALAALVCGALLLAGADAFIGGMMAAPVQGRGRGRGRSSMYMGPEEFDESWWTPPPPVGPDPFLHGYSSRVYPRHPFGMGGMPHGGYGAAHHFWGGPSYHYPLNMPWWRGQSSGQRLQQGGGASSTAMPYYTPRDSFGMHYGGTFPMASPYYYTPPPLQGDWNLPKNPPPPPGGAAGGDAA